MKHAAGRFLVVFPFLWTALIVYAQDDFRGNAHVPGDSAVAGRYALWAKDAVEKGQWNEALAALERALDFADISSDICYLLALARSHENRDKGSILEALNRAISVDRWELYTSETARLLRAETLIIIKAYEEALEDLSMVRSSPGEAVLTLKALAGSRPWEFHRYMTETLDRYPRENGPVRVFFSFLSGKDAAGPNPERADLELLSLITRRLPALLLRDPELAWMAAPFMEDSAEAKRLVSAYRAVNKPVPESLPAALLFGVINEETALEELFDAGKESRLILDAALLAGVWKLLRHEEARVLFRRNLSAFTGVITDDTDGDGISDSFAEYYEGMLRSYTYDANQDGIPELIVEFKAGNPHRARAFVPPGKMAVVQWERYPSVLEAELDGVRYIARPLEFHFSPLTFVNLWNSGLLFPQRDPLSPPLTRRVLVTNVLRVERPSPEFKGGIEVVELNQGIPVRAREYVGDLMVSETEFLRGRPQFQRVDLDFDGRMETVRRFRRSYREVEIEELWDYDRDIDYAVSDWNGDGIFEN